MTGYGVERSGPFSSDSILRMICCGRLPAIVCPGSRSGHAALPDCYVHKKSGPECNG